MPPPSHAQNEVMPCAVPSQPFAVEKKTIKQHCGHLFATLKRSSPAFSKKKNSIVTMCVQTPHGVSTRGKNDNVFLLEEK